MAALPWRLKHWTGSAWANAELRRFNGTSEVTVNQYFWDGASWVLCTDRTPPTSTHTVQYSAIWSKSYQGNNTGRTDSNATTNRYQGNSGQDSWGIQKSAWGLASAVQSDIAGAVAYYSARVFMTNLHTWYASGGTCRLGTHAQQSSAPANFPHNRDALVDVHFNKAQAQWVNLNTNWCAWAAEGSFYGHTIYANTSDVTYYGYYSTSITHEQSYEK